MSADLMIASCESLNGSGLIDFDVDYPETGFDSTAERNEVRKVVKMVLEQYDAD